MSETRPTPRIPPGQVATKGWSVLHAGGVPNVSKKGSWSLYVHGQVDHPIRIGYDELLGLERITLTCDIHCVTSWSRLDTAWEGVRFRDLISIAHPNSKAHFAIFESEQSFTTNLPLSVFCNDDVLIAYRADGRDLEPEHGGPVRMLVPRRYFYKSAKWLRGIKLSEEDEPGFWEVRGYSNTADPWRQERYAGLCYIDLVKNRLKAYGRKKW